MASVNGLSQAKWKYVNSSCPFFTRAYSGSIGSFTLTIISASAYTSPMVGKIFAPTSSYSLSGNPLFSPAECCTNTVCPCFISSATPAGVIPTRFSLSLISIGIPIFILFSALVIRFKYSKIINTRQEEKTKNFIYISTNQSHDSAPHAWDPFPYKYSRPDEDPAHHHLRP